MAIVFYGSKEATIGIEEFFVRCPACEAHNFADVMVISRYYHIYFIPIFPFEKEANVFCKKCGLRRFNIPFGNKLISDFETVKKRFRHPWYTYTFFYIVALFILLSFLG